MQANELVDALQRSGYHHYCGVPCSYLQPVSNYVLQSDRLTYVGAADEGQAVAIASGMQLAGCPSVAMFQNSGLGNAVNPLTSLNAIFRIPLLLLCTHRGDPQGRPDEPQHRLMGRITPSLLDLMEILWEDLPDSVEELQPSLRRAQQQLTPYAFLIKAGVVDNYALAPRPLQPTGCAPPSSSRREIARHRRGPFLEAILAAMGPPDVIIATTGYTSRELWALQDRDNHFYMVGSMGCAAGLGLGVTLAQPRRRVVVIDGDGALLMRMGVLATVGHESPGRFVHIVLDNQRHESTGGQATVSADLDLCGLALSCGYRNVSQICEPDQLAPLLELEGPHFIHIPILAGVPANLPRPTQSPPEVAERFRQFLR